jgi:hypothetical protein
LSRSSSYSWQWTLATSNVSVILDEIRISKGKLNKVANLNSLAHSCAILCRWNFVACITLVWGTVVVGCCGPSVRMQNYRQLRLQGLHNYTNASHLAALLSRWWHCALLVTFARYC